MLSFAGQKVLVIGCSSGIGRATAEGLLALGADVLGVDWQASDLALSAFLTCDLRQREAAGQVLAWAGQGLDCVFYCAGLPQTRPFADVIAVNFLSLRTIADGVIPAMRKEGSVSVIASTAGNGWVNRAPLVNSFLDLPSDDAAQGWIAERAAELGDSYMFSKEAVILWMMRSCARFIRQGVRLNCLSPGPTWSGMTKDFESFGGPALIDVFTQPLGRRSSPQEQAWPLIFLGSRQASYINGCNFITDAGFTSSIATGQIDLDQLIAQATAPAAGS